MKVSCSICDVEFDVKLSRIKRLKWGRITCGKWQCTSELKSQMMSGQRNHQFGLIGNMNSSFKGEETVSNYGYILEYCPNHPRPHDVYTKGARVKQHRLVVERNHQLFDQIFFEEINGWIVLKEEYDVHHKDENITNNELNNLEVLTRSKHTTLHNSKKTIIRDISNGRIIGVSKSG